jgi:Holliday junction resolvasome RuvABC endonuclease subunit
MGLDASTTTIGMSVVSFDDDNTTLDYFEFFKPPKKGSIFERLSKVREYIIATIDKFKPDVVVLEDIFLFMQGKSNAQTITILSALNRTVGTAVYDKMKGNQPFLYSVHFIRNNIKDTTKVPAKEDIPDLVGRILDIEFPYTLNRLKNKAAENFDVADSIAAALCYVEIERNGRSHEQIKPKKKKKIRRKKK